MDEAIEVSAIIPTYNRRDLVADAIRTVLAQTRPVQEIIVVDDGSTDGTGDFLQRTFGERVRHVWQPNAGVSAARNHGLRLARGRYLALLDSDDAWAPDKTRLQLQWLQARPDFGMVLCDVARVDAQLRQIDVLRRREHLPEDGHILQWVLLSPALVPATVMMRREVFDTVGGFDERLATGEDLDFHLRVAARWPIGVVEQPLVRAMRGHDGLSSLGRTYDDYVAVIERAAQAARGQVPDSVCRQALARAYAQGARGMVHARHWSRALRLARQAWSHEAGAPGRARLLRLLPLAARCAAAGLARRRA